MNFEGGELHWKVNPWKTKNVIGQH